MSVITDVLLDGILTVLGVLLFAVVSYLTPKIKRWIVTVVDKDNTGIIEAVVDMGVELAEEELSGEEGAKKFHRAVDFAILMLGRYGIDVSHEFVSGAVQTGWRRMDDKQKSKGDIINE